ncbi:MAG: hypothetical protein J6M27_00800, partial [Lachnospiraceae bacterium]|nr:hypothetical protein [Lachnospiraceae bacterium]
TTKAYNTAVKMINPRALNKEAKYRKKSYTFFAIHIPSPTPHEPTLLILYFLPARQLKKLYRNAIEK